MAEGLAEAIRGNLERDAVCFRYLLAGSSGEAERLRIQALAWELQVEILLTEMGVKPGWRCIDVGRDSQGIIGPLAGRVGRGGSVVAFDRDPVLLTAARQCCKSEEFGNVEFRQGDLFAMDLPAGSFDLVRARLCWRQLAGTAKCWSEWYTLFATGA